MAVPDVSALGLARIFSPAQAAEILRELGLADLTECALRTRAYRRQVPFHQSGRRIIFTVDDPGKSPRDSHIGPSLEHELKDQRQPR